MRATLLVDTEGDTPRRVELGERNSIGRHHSQSVQLLDRMVSKEHARIDDLGGAFRLLDVGSRNGTFLNGRRVEGPQALRDGDEIRLGNTRLRFVESFYTEHTTLGGPSTLAPRVSLAPGSIASSLQHQVPQPEAGDYPAECELDDEAVRREYERLRLAAALQRELGDELEPDVLLGRLLDYLFATLSVERGVALLVDDQGELRPRALRRRQAPADQDDAEIAISQTLLDAVVDGKTAVLSSDARMDSRFAGAESIIIHGIRSTMCVPLLARGRLLGVVLLDNRIRAGAFTSRDLAVLQGLAAQAAVAIDNALLRRRLEREAVTRRQFERLLSPNLVDKVVSGELAIEKGGQQRRGAVLFSDIRGFTQLSEAQPAQEIVAWLNEYFEAAVEVVFEQEGTLDKYLGDGFLAVWGAPVSAPDDALRAVRAAVGIQRVMRELNEQRQAEGVPPIGVGVGIDCGDIVAGYMGSSRTMGYTVIGHAVNVASRLCAAAAAGEILVSEATWARVAPHAHGEPLPPMALKGVRDKVRVVRVTGLRSLV